ncbi:hypothetical protein L1987_33659 [Smallanthus sonchifolius]|uniref:Uncharacterized protein n=1 Tax=Smallanthus sonchifolius TaxID=185202 RepID=A0ACB9HR51_9ASTR|nr:hypothetical protein L1987_33659 [Smallanthus sonchifolius]
MTSSSSSNIQRIETTSSTTEPKTQEPESSLANPLMNRDLAAVKLQKTYRAFRTRRHLADSAVVIEELRWKALDFAQLKSSMVSAFEVGKGSSKNDKARKLALQDWLEAVDPLHRYGHNLQFYYAKWLHCESTQPFFYWLDIGEGKGVDLEKCPRTKLLQQCIKYRVPRFELKEILSATNNFSNENLITEGALGNVYRGQLQQNGNLMNFTVRSPLWEETNDYQWRYSGRTRY